MLKAVDATATEDSSANVTNIRYIDKAAIHCKFSASNSGTFHVFVRTGKTPIENYPWFELNFGSALTITSQTECLIEMQQLDFEDLYLQWVPSAGSGTLTATLHMSSVGA